MAAAKSGVEGRGSEQCLRNRLRGSKRDPSDGKNELSEPRDLAGACSGGNFVVSRTGEAYDVRAKGPNRKFRLDYFEQRGKRWVRKPSAPSAGAGSAPTDTAPIASLEPATNVRKNSSPKMMKTIRS